MRSSLSRPVVLPLAIVLALAAIAVLLFARKRPDALAAVDVDPSKPTTASGVSTSALDDSIALVPSDSDPAGERSVDRGKVSGDGTRSVVESVPAEPAPIGGRVQSLNGEPGGDCFIECAYMSTLGKTTSFNQVSIACDAKGAFETPELGATAVVALTARRKLAGGDPSSPLWVGHVENIRPGTRDVIIVLSPALTVRGNVRDDAGSLQARTRVRAAPVHRAWPIPTNIGAVRGTFDGSNGTFEIAGLYPGTWNVIAECKGFAVAMHSVELPRDGADVQVVLPRFAILSGVLVDGSDRPVADARVSAGVRKEGAIETSLTFSSSDSPGLLGESGSDLNGHFTLMGAAPGHVILSARKDDAGLSGTLQLDVKAGETRDDLRVVLLPSAAPPPK